MGSISYFNSRSGTKSFFKFTGMHKEVGFYICMLETGDRGVHKWGKYISNKSRESMLAVVKTESKFQSE